MAQQPATVCAVWPLAEQTQFDWPFMRPEQQARASTKFGPPALKSAALAPLARQVQLPPPSALSEQHLPFEAGMPVFWPAVRQVQAPFID